MTSTAPTPTVRIDIYQDPAGSFHYEIVHSGQPRARVSVCGLDTRQLRAAAWFPIGDVRGWLHYDRACDGCQAVWSA